MEQYNPPPGLGLIFLEWFPDRGEVIVEWTASPLQPDPVYRKSIQDIRHELGTTWRSRVLNDNITSHPKSPRRALVIESILNHPFLTGEVKSINAREILPAGMELTTREMKKAAEEAKDVHEITMTPEQAEAQLRLGSTGEKLNIEPFEVRQDHHKEQVLTRGGEKVEYKDKYGPEYNVYLSGVIDSG